MISEEKRNATVISNQMGKLLEIDRMLFQLALEKDKSLKEFVYKKFQERIKKGLIEKTETDKEQKPKIFESLRRLLGLK